MMEDILITKFKELDPYTQLLILEELPYKSLKNLCVVSKYFAELCSSEYVRNIIKKKYDERPFTYLYPCITHKEWKIFKKNKDKIYDDIKKIFEPMLYKSYFILSRKKLDIIPPVEPLKYRKEKYVEQIPEEYYDISMGGVYNKYNKTWLILRNKIDTDIFDINKFEINLAHPNMPYKYESKSGNKNLVLYALIDNPTFTSKRKDFFSPYG